MKRWLTAVIAYLLFSVAPAAEPLSLLEKADGVDTRREVTLVLEDIRPLDGDYRGHVYLRFFLEGDELGLRAYADYNERGDNSVEVLSLETLDNTVSAEMRIVIGPDGARRGRAHFPTPPDEFRVSFSAELSTDEWARTRPDREAFMPNWRKDTPSLAGRNLTGSYSGVWRWGDKREENVEGAVSGAWRPMADGAGWRAAGPAWVEAVEGGVDLHAFLPESPRVENIDAWAEFGFDSAVPLGTDTLSVTLAPLTGDAPRDRMPVSLALKTDRGWFHAWDALDAVKGEPTSLDIPFEKFGDHWRPFAGEKLEAVRVGVVNGEGVGRVDLLLTECRLLDRVPGDPDVEPEVVTVVVRPETVFAFNGADTIPDGLFGFHDVGHDKPRDPKGDEPDAVGMMAEFRPGLLRPLTHTGFGAPKEVPTEVVEDADPEREPTLFERRAAAGGAEDLVVWTHTMDLWARPAWMDQGLEPLLENVRGFYAREAAHAWTPEHPRRVMRWFEVWNEPFMWGRHINMGFRLPEGVKNLTDETQFGYIPGKLGADAWSEIFLAAVEGAKAVNPHAMLGGPSAPDPSSHDYMDFRNYTLRILERVGDKLDFFTEHHYGGNPLLVAAGYEVVRAAMWTLHQRHIPIINTEANDLGASAAGKAVYNLTEILHLINTQPDLVKGRALHALWNGYVNSSGERDAWRLMAPLRGRILDTLVDAPRLTAVAAHPEPGQLVLVGVDHGFGDVKIRMPMPREFRVMELTLLLTDTPREELQVRDVDGAGLPEIPKGGTRLVKILPRLDGGFLEFSMPERSGFRLTLLKPGYKPSRVRNQRFRILPVLFHELEEGETLDIGLPETVDPDRTFLRSVTTGSLELVYGNESLTLPRRGGRPGEAPLSTFEVPPAAISNSPKLRAGPGGALVLSCGWVWED